MNTLLRACGLYSVGLMLLAAGCKTAPEQKSAFEEKVLSEEASLASLRYEVIDFTDEFARTIEFAADQIESQTTDPTIRRHALRWKMHGVPKAFLCLDHPSPVAGLLDLWTLAVQMDAYYRTGPGRDAFGEWQSIATEATTHLIQSVEDVMRKCCREDSFEIAQGHLAEFAAAHPFEGDLFSSPSVTRALPERFVPTADDVFSSISSLETEVRQLQAKTGLYMEHMPRQARWQAERLIDEQLWPQITNVLGQVPVERQLILEDVDRQRLDTLRVLREEREVVLMALRGEIVQVEAALDQLVSETVVDLVALIERERTLTLAAIDEQRRQTLATVAADLDRVSREGVDRAYTKVWGVLGVVWVGVALLLVLARLLFPPAKGRT
jgi:hypothetical protein